MSNPQKDSSKMEMYFDSKYNDIYNMPHGEFCLDLLNHKSRVKKIIHSKIFGKTPIEKQIKKKHIIFKYSHIWRDSEYYVYRIAGVNGEPNTKSNETIVDKIESNQVTWIRDITIKSLEMGYPLIKKYHNEYPSRLRSIDLYCTYDIFSYLYFSIDDKEHTIHEFVPDFSYEFVTPFKVGITVSSLSIIARDIEFYRKTLEGIEKEATVLPIFIGPEKINTTQFDSITFDEIKELEQKLHD